MKNKASLKDAKHAGENKHKTEIVVRGPLQNLMTPCQEVS